MIKVLVLNPPNFSRSLNNFSDWINREDRHSGMAFIMIPYTLCSIVGTIRRYAPDVNINMLDARVCDMGFEDVKKYVFDLQPDLIVTLLGAFTIKHDKPYTEFPIPTISVLCPVSTDVEEAIERFDLQGQYYTATSELENTIALAIEEYSQTGSISKTPGMLIREDDTLIKTPTSVDSNYYLKPLGFPAFDLLDMNRYFAYQKRFPHNLREFRGGYVNIQFSKGCRYHCTFCGNYYIPPAEKKTEQVIEEIRYFYERYGCKNFDFIVSEFTMNLANAKELCRGIIDAGFGIRWTTNDRVDIVDEELIALMKDAGCFHIRYGIETANSELRSKIEREQDDDIIKRVFGWCRKYGIKTQANFIVGLPEEKPDYQQMNIALVKKIKPDSVAVTPIILQPSTPMYCQLKAQRRITNYDWSKYKRNIFDRDELFFRHRFYKDYRHVLCVQREVARQMMAVITWRDLWRNNSRMPFFIRLFRYISYCRFTKLVKKYEGVYRIGKTVKELLLTLFTHSEEMN